MGLLQELEISSISFNHSDLGSASIDNISAPNRFHSAVLLWNYRGLGNPNALDAT